MKEMRPTPSLCMWKEGSRQARRLQIMSFPFDICLSRNVHNSENTEKQVVFLKWVIVPNLHACYKTPHYKGQNCIYVNTRASE